MQVYFPVICPRTHVNIYIPVFPSPSPVDPSLVSHAAPPISALRPQILASISLSIPDIPHLMQQRFPSASASLRRASASSAPNYWPRTLPFRPDKENSWWSWLSLLFFSIATTIVDVIPLGSAHRGHAQRHLFHHRTKKAVVESGAGRGLFAAMSHGACSLRWAREGVVVCG